MTARKNRHLRAVPDQAQAETPADTTPESTTTEEPAVYTFLERYLENAGMVAAAMREYDISDMAAVSLFNITLSAHLTMKQMGGN